MSFVRLGQDSSQVYIFDHVDGYVVCCFCAFTPWDADAERIARPDFHTTDLDAMLAHIAEHRAAGHVVPDWVDQRLRDEWDESEPAGQRSDERKGQA